MFTMFNETDVSLPRPAEVSSAGPLRTLLYCHDTYGLGHLRRTLGVAGMLSASPLAGAQLIVSGSPAGHRFPLSSGTDIVSLPTVVKVGADRYEARRLPLGYPAVHALRRASILAVAQSYRPDLVIVDHAAAGLDGEILPALEELRRVSPQTRLVLGLRDVVDDASTVRTSWAREGTHALLDELYDAVVVYGERDLYDVTREYGFSAQAAAKTRFVGYLGRATTAPDRAGLLARHGLAASRLALVTVGGGGDGARLVEAVLEAARGRHGPADLSWLVVGGPLMPPADWNGLTRALDGLPNVRATRFLEDLPAHIGAADAVISMGGYNSVCEILSAARPALIVPRVEPRREQWIRARMLQRRGLVRTLHPAELDRRSLVRELHTLLEAGPVSVPDGMLDGFPRLEAELVALMSASAEESMSVRAGAWSRLGAPDRAAQVVAAGT